MAKREKMRRLLHAIEPKTEAPISSVEQGQQEEEEEEEVGNEDAEENTDAAFDLLRYHASLFHRRRSFETPINPSVALRRSTNSVSLVIWTVWALVLFCGWWHLNSVSQAPIPRAEILRLQQSIADTIERQKHRSTEFHDRLNRFNEIQEALGAAFRYPLSILLFPLCDHDELFSESFFEDLIHALHLQSSTFLYPPRFVYSIESLAHYFQSIQAHQLHQYCNPQAQKLSTEDILSIERSIYSHIDSLRQQQQPPSIAAPTPYVLVYLSASLPAPTVVVSDMPIALISAPSGMDHVAASATALVLSVWFERSDVMILNRSPIRPEYVWRFLLLGDGKSRVSWDFKSTVKDALLTPFLSRIQHLTDIEISSNVILDAGLHSLIPPAELNASSSPTVYLTVQHLFGFQSLAYGWMNFQVLSKPTNNLPEILNYAVYFPTDAKSVLKLKTPVGTLKQSFSMSRWGTIVFPNCDPDSSVKVHYPSRRELEESVSMWMVHWRVLLGLPGVNLLAHLRAEQDLLIGRSHRHVTIRLQTTAAALMEHSFSRTLFSRIAIDGIHPSGQQLLCDVHLEIPQRSGITLWELHRVGRHALWTFLGEGVSLLASLFEILDDKPDLKVEPQLSERTRRAVDYLRFGLNYVNNNDDATHDLWTALNHSRLGYQLAKESLHDPTTTSRLFLKIEYTVALYLPLALPFILPLLVAWIREFQLYRHRLKKRVVE